MSQQEIIEYGRKITAIIEAICVPNLNGEALKFTQLNLRCQESFEHPDWDKYEKIVLKCKKIWEDET